MSQMQSGPQGAGQGTGAGGAIPAAPRSKWPKVIGIISIVLASLAIICTPASLAMQKLDPNQRHVFEQLPGWFNIYMTAAGVWGVLVGILFLAAGITLVLRKPAARPLHLVYACLAIIMCLVGIFVSVAAFSGAPVEGSMKAGMVAGFACSLPLGLAYPVFLLIWFLRGSIARETASWRGPPQG